ncbi:hypothetical protein [uncultured Rikenella sp.]|uniref:hypothetical protein n=1 Tax=uncultured Rikenella sp. TaxID=368003 RepID=UPI00260FC781|nr:hypothetical protein [uncultured Rikenella sp.]
MKGDFPAREMRVVAELEEGYRWVAELVKPSELEENPLPAARVYMSALRNLERCVELRMKLVREAGGMPEPEPEEPVATVDLSRLSDGALREVERAMVPSVPEPLLSELSTPGLQCPKPSTPGPSTQEPLLPELSTPELQCPEPSTPGPLLSELSTPGLQCPEPSAPEPLLSELSTPELQCPEPSTPEPLLSELSTPEPLLSELSTPELQCPEPSTQEPDEVLPEGAQGTDGAENGGDDRNRSCEKKICAAVEPPKDTKKRTAAARPRGSRSGPARGAGSGSRSKSPSSG